MIYPIRKTALRKISKLLNLQTRVATHYHLFGPTPPIHRLIIEKNINKFSAHERAIWGAAELLIRKNRLYHSWNGGLCLLPNPHEVRKCCAGLNSEPSRHHSSIQHIAEIFGCSCKLLKQYSSDDYWPLLIHLDPKLDAFLDLRNRTRSGGRQTTSLPNT